MLLRSGHIAAWYSGHDSDVHLIHRRLELKSDRRENSSHPLCTAHFAPVFRRFPLLHGSGAGIPGIGILIYSSYCSIGISSGDGIYSRT